MATSILSIIQNVILPMIILLLLQSTNVPTMTEPKCNTKITISNHSSLYLTSFITTAFIYHYSCYQRVHRCGGRGYVVCLEQIKRIWIWRFEGEYTVFETVYDELLDGFDDDDLSSYMQEDRDGDGDGDSNSIGAIINHTVTKPKWEWC